MSRRRRSKKRTILQDPIYNSTLVSMMINMILLKGKKTLAQQIFYETMINIKKTSKEDPIDILKKAVQNATPIVEVKSRRIGGATYQVPTEVKPERGNSIALKLIVKNARKRAGRGMITKLTNEILDAYNKTGGAVRRKEEIHRMAEANKAFSNIRL